MSNPNTLTLDDFVHLELDEFDVVDYLTSEDAIAAYLTSVLESGDSKHLAHALDNVMRARGVTNLVDLTKVEGIGVLNVDGQLTLEILTRVLSALNMRLVTQVIALPS